MNGEPRLHSPRSPSRRGPGAATRSAVARTARARSWRRCWPGDVCTMLLTSWAMNTAAVASTAAVGRTSKVLCPHQGPSALGRWHRRRQPGVMEDLGSPGAHSRAVRPARQTAGLPAGYPQEPLRMVTLREGRSVLTRPVQPSDAPARAEAIQSADADTIRRRYLGGHPQITPGLLNFLTNVDYTS